MIEQHFEGKESAHMFYSQIVNRSKQTKQKDEYFDEICFDGEKLYHVQENQMEELLHKNIGPLIIHFKSLPGKPAKGSGLLISPNLVLTTAHNIYNHIKREKFQKCWFYPGQCGALNEGYEVECFFYDLKYEKDPGLTYDYALLKLAKQVKRHEFIPLCGDVQKLKNKSSSAKLAIFGYPRSSYQQLSKHGGNEATYQWGLMPAGRIIQINEQKEEIVHLISTQIGLSGTSIILVENQMLTAIGIHKGGLKRKGNFVGNHGKLITPTLIDILSRQALKLKAIMFKVYPQQKMDISNRSFNGSEEQQNFKGPKRDKQQKQWESQMINQIGPMLVQAAKNLVKAVEVSKKLANKYNKLGNLHSQQNQQHQAVKFYKKAIEIDPKLVHAYNGLGNVFSKLKQQQQAIKWYKKAIEIDPKLANAYNGIGNAYSNLNQKQLSVEWYKKAIKIDFNYSLPYSNWIFSLDSLHSAEDALLFFTKIKSLHPDQFIVNQALEKLQKKIKKLN